MTEATKSNRPLSTPIEVRTREKTEADGTPVVVVEETEADGTTHRRVYPVDAVGEET